MYDENYWSDEYEFDDGEYAEDESWDGEEPYWEIQQGRYPLQVLPDFTFPVGIAAVLFLIYVLTLGGPVTEWRLPISEGQSIQTIREQAPAVSLPPVDQEAFAAPYTNYVVTQGVHGASYGQMAIDIAAGKGTPILSPINGTITQNDVDQYGNPTLVIENDIYAVKLLHGIYSAQVGQTVTLGEKVGEESNLGYTTDMRGILCAGRTDPCGYHTHINVYDKRMESNVNPLLLMDR